MNPFLNGSQSLTTTDNVIDISVNKIKSDVFGQIDVPLLHVLMLILQI